LSFGEIIAYFGIVTSLFSSHIGAQLFSISGCVLFLYVGCF